MPNMEILHACKRLLEALDVDDPLTQIDSLIRTEKLRRKEHLSEGELDELIELMTEHHDLLCTRW